MSDIAKGPAARLKVEDRLAGIHSEEHSSWFPVSTTIQTAAVPQTLTDAYCTKGLYPKIVQNRTGSLTSCRRRNSFYVAWRYQRLSSG
ncbi:hypothetical protein AVEN_161805-1 [Araneus ventricosus]|uniref:Uncharacterized protein n=1 Tax=Araneus ventricosus TaxID=182803 RepID=A0A4Y2ERY3_ARAVE|nr:hypothetical protein AVEN_161805-1 [Araneus ventricosus]